MAKTKQFDMVVNSRNHLLIRRVNECYTQLRDLVSSISLYTEKKIYLDLQTSGWQLDMQALVRREALHLSA